MAYIDLIQSYLQRIPVDLIDFDVERTRGRVPTQASSEFITNREQGDWAEDLLLRAINESDLGVVAVKYGKSEKRVTGEEGFEEFYEEYQDELDTIGKRPDVLIFHRGYYNPEWNYDISQIPRGDLDQIVVNALAGIEVRSSSFLFEKYSNDVAVKVQANRDRIFELKQQLLRDYMDVFAVKAGWTEILNSITEGTINIIKFQSPGWSASARFKQASELIKELKSNLISYQKRNFLSITPKVEDIKVVVKWIETYNVPHFYFQVFFDRVYGLPFVTILDFISDPANEDRKYFLEGDVKNQNKITIKINPTDGFLVAGRVDMPQHRSEMKELNRGRLLFYVTFDGGVAYLDLDSLIRNLNLAPNE
jgi:hypothetical protein